MKSPKVNLVETPFTDASEQQKIFTVLLRATACPNALIAWSLDRNTLYFPEVKGKKKKSAQQVQYLYELERARENGEG